MSAKQIIKKLLRESVAVAGRILPHADAGEPRILCYHGVRDNPPDEWSVTPEQFRRQMEIVTKTRHPVSLMEIVNWVRGGPTPPKGAVAVTFDDGFLDVYERAAPIMADLKIPGTAFICSDLADQKEASADASFVAGGPFMTWDQIRELHQAGWTIGSHALNHPPLSSLDPEDSRRQIQESRKSIEHNLGTPCETIAYPYGTPGTVSDREGLLSEEAGYLAAFMNTNGLPKPQEKPFFLPRTKVLGSDSAFVFHSSLSGAMDLWRLVENRG
ncbi:MAG: polysaccharide deacetylase family protein [Magnetococcales bacterium]|nr:polysaccharide deacetylase family protein [Magnetococcales bacterium]